MGMHGARAKCSNMHSAVGIAVSVLTSNNYTTAPGLFHDPLNKGVRDAALTVVIYTKENCLP